LIKTIRIYFMRLETFSSTCFILSDESSIPFYSSNGYSFIDNGYNFKIIIIINELL